MYRLGGQQDSEFDDQLALGADGAQIELAAADDHVIEQSIERKLVFACPPRNHLSHSRAVAPDEHRGCLRPTMPRIRGEQPQQIAVVGFRRVENVESLLLSVM